MVGRTLLDSASPVTQSIDAVKTLLSCLGRPTDSEVVDLGVVKLVLSNKGDVFYCVTAKACSCPSACYRPGSPCKHQRKYFLQPKKAQAEIEAESDAEIDRLHKAKWAGGFNGPVDLDTIKAKTEASKASIHVNFIDAYAPITTEEEIRYWQEKAEKQGQEA
jgi:hypothetical protein